MVCLIFLEKYATATLMLQKGYDRKTQFVVSFSAQGYITHTMPRYEQFYKCWMDYNKPLLIVRYEDMKIDTITQLKKMLKFLNITNVGEDILNCVSLNTRSDTLVRQKVYEYPFENISKSLLDQIPELKKRVDNILAIKENADG